MNHLNDCFHHWHCASGSCKHHLLPCSKGILLQDFIWLYLQTAIKAANRDPENGGLAISHWKVYMPHRHSWGMFKVPFMCNHCLDDPFDSVSFVLQQLILGIVFAGHTTMAYNKWEWERAHWLIKSTQHWLPSPRWPSTIVWQPGKQGSLGSLQSLVPEMEHNVSAMKESTIPRFIMHWQLYFVVSMQIVLNPCQMFKPQW